MKKAGKLRIFGALALLGTALAITGCKSTPELTKADAQALIQAEYDHRPAVGAPIAVQDLGMGQGLIAKYWVKSKVYPNRFWADFTLTPDGKKVVTISGGGDVIQWHPETANDPHYNVMLFAVPPTHLKVKDIKDVQDSVIPGASAAKSVEFSEALNLEGIPAPLVDIAHDPGNKLTTKRVADFTYDGSAWKLHSIQ